jgi:hypothetical protein
MAPCRLIGCSPVWFESPWSPDYVLLTYCPCAEVLAIAGDAILTEVRPLAMSLYEARTHGSRCLVLY